MKSLLALLANGEFHSGTTIGAVLGVSRTSVWKYLQSINELGLPIQALRGKGYRIQGGLELLEQNAIIEYLSDDVAQLITEIDIHLQIDSTNANVMSRLQLGSIHGIVCMAEYQSLGRGRRGKPWVSPLARNIYLSIGWEFSNGAIQLEGLSLAIGIRLAELLMSLGIDGVQLKWPNDILINGEKVGGILLEIGGDPSGLCSVVIGIGLNVNMSSKDIIDQPYTSLSQHMPCVSRNYIAARLIDSIIPMLQSFQQVGFAHYHEKWTQFDAYYDKEITINRSPNSLPLVGIAKGVLPNGALRVLADGREHQICGGAVSLRRR